MNIGRLRSSWRWLAISRTRAKQLQTGLNVRVSRVKLSRTLIGVQCIRDLVVAGLILPKVSDAHQTRNKVAYQCSQIIPHFRDVWVQSDGTRVRIQGIPILVDLVVKDSNRAPEGRIAAITVNSLLVCLIGLGILLL